VSDSSEGNDVHPEQEPENPRRKQRAHLGCKMKEEVIDQTPKRMYLFSSGTLLTGV